MSDDLKALQGSWAITSLEVDGAGGTLRLCVAPPGKPRPATFASKPGDGRLVTTWRPS